MNSTRTFLVFILFLLGFVGLKAQSNANASGIEATGLDGTISASVGQVFFSTYGNAFASAKEGVQHPFEFSTTTEITEAKSTTSEIKISTNPNFLQLSLGTIEFEEISINLYDISGKHLKSIIPAAASIRIGLSNFPSSTYILNVDSKGKTIKKFKIVKGL